MNKEQKREKAKSIIKSYRKEQSIVFTKHQEIITLKNEVHPHEMMKHFYQVTFAMLLGENWKFEIQDLEKHLDE